MHTHAHTTGRKVHFDCLLQHRKLPAIRFLIKKINQESNKKNFLLSTQLILFYKEE